MNHKLNHLYLMKLFVAIVQHGSFSRAAIALKVTATKASKDIRHLEKTLDSQLFNRTTRSVNLTDSGEVYFKSAIDILDLHSQMIDNINVMKSTLNGELRVTAPSLWGEVILVPIILLFKEIYPQVKFIADFSNDTNDIFRDNIHIAFRSTELENEPYLARFIAKDEYILCANPDYLSNNPIIKTPEDLVDHHMITFSQKTGQLECLEFIYQNQKVKQSVISSLAFNNKNAIYAAVKSGFGIAVLPKYLILEGLNLNTVVEVLPQYHIKSSAFYALYTHRQKDSALVNKFIDFV